MTPYAYPDMNSVDALGIATAGITALRVDSLMAFRMWLSHASAPLGFGPQSLVCVSHLYIVHVVMEMLIVLSSDRCHSVKLGWFTNSTVCVQWSSVASF
jgi:hypothetical protein